ncbi:hypothetical protein BOTNAR_0481g00060 [Botryotinia narcissicola]|uniref:Uncharacterized protein n=1 Tax=Botryotinia narcissicola TaxID=278944 RepID=A0A4Z1HHE9_9HELO|nr:hypothetical protein BOTNAR_0481g00060 [Botryotinia narcissicola]
MNFLPLFATAIMASCVILVVSAIPKHAFFPAGFVHKSCPANPDDVSKCNMRLTVTVDLNITGPEGYHDCGVDAIGNGIPWAAKDSKPRCFDDKGTWELTVGRDGQAPDFVIWSSVKYRLNKVDAGNMNNKTTQITTYNMPFNCTI